MNDAAIAPNTEPGQTKDDALLVVDGVERSFGGLKAVDVAHLEVQRSTITALIGPNGAGKTTFFNLLTGFDKPDGGRWSLEGVPLQGMAAHRIARQGMVRTFQLTKVLSRMTVLENVKLGAQEQRGERILTSLWSPAWRAQEREITERAHAAMERFRLTHMADEFAGTLSGGQRKLLEMARALMANPKLVMLDEPMAGVNPALKVGLLEHVVSLQEDGTTVIFVEHDMDAVMGISDWVVCLAQGQVISEGTPRAVGADPKVIDAYLGGHHSERHDDG